MTDAQQAASPAAPLVEFDHVSRQFGSFRLALADVSFLVGRGEFVLLTGPSGAGKSTVLQLVAALDAPSSGTVRVAGQDLGRLRKAAVPLLRRSMGIVLQDPMLLDDRDVLANVMLPALVTGVAPAEARTRARTALERAGLAAEALWSARPRALSGGEQQRAALARAIVNRPALVLADEPVAHLDEAAAAGIFATLAQFANAGVTVLIATHAVPSVLTLTPRVLALAEGRLVPSGGERVLQSQMPNAQVPKAQVPLAQVRQ
jgi:cell division transport system ATP-binding protein